MTKQLHFFIATKHKLTEDDIIFIKDRIFMSDAAYFEFYNTLDLNNVFPSNTSLLSEKVRDMFELQPTDDGYDYSIEQMVKFIILQSLKEENTIPVRIKWKLALYARNIGYGQTVVCMIPLNMMLFTTQSVSSVFYISLFEGDEDTVAICRNTIRLRDALSRLSSIEAHDDKVVKYHMNFFGVSNRFEITDCCFQFDED